MMTSLPTTPGERVPLSTTLATLGTCHQVTPVAQILAASVRTTGVPSANRDEIAAARHRTGTEPIRVACSNLLNKRQTHISFFRINLPANDTNYAKRNIIV